MYELVATPESPITWSNGSFCNNWPWDTRSFTMRPQGRPHNQIYLQWPILSLSIVQRG